MMAGFDGVVDYNAGGNDRRLVVAGEAGPLCVAEIDPDLLKIAASPEDLPRFDCRAGIPGVLASDDLVPPDRRSKQGTTIAGRNRR